MNSLPRLHRTLVALSLTLCLAAVSALAQDTPAPPPIEAPSAEAPAAEPASERVSLEEVRRFVSVFRAVQQAYVDSVDDQQLMQSAIRGLLTDLDPHSAYLDARATQSMNETATGAYGGLGLEILHGRTAAWW